MQIVPVVNIVHIPTTCVTDKHDIQQKKSGLKQQKILFLRESEYDQAQNVTVDMATTGSLWNQTEEDIRRTFFTILTITLQQQELQIEIWKV